MRARSRRRCGSCGGTIDRGAPMLSIEVLADGYALSAPKLRCPTCAGEPVPCELPDLPVHVSIEPTPLTRLGALVSSLPFDYKQAQAGREPGDENDADV